MKKILLFGAGKSATVLIEYLAKTVAQENWQLTVADADPELVKSKLKNTTNTTAASFDIVNETERQKQIQNADIVISLLPPALHILVAKDCILLKKNLLTASYVDEQMKALKDEIKNNDLLFICELGLDPGIDHMSAKKMIDEIEEEGGEITSFISHCGGLVAPESDDNPWHYKISWNPRNVVLAGKAGAVYKQNNHEIQLTYDDLFKEKRFTDVKGLETLCWYPNRDSLSYIDIYGLHNCATFIRTTLRHPDFMYGWKNIIDLKLTDETVQYETQGKSLMEFFKEHMDRYNFTNWLEQKLQAQFEATKNIIAELVNLTEMEQKAAKKGVEHIDEFMVVNEEGDLEEIDIEDLKLNAAAALADKMHDAKLTLKQLFFIGLGDEDTKINKEKCSAADVLQFALENKLALQPTDKDMVVMKHEIEFILKEETYRQTATLVVKGKDNMHTAMAKTVGLPLGITAKQILKGAINLKGLHIPVTKEIYEPVLNELAAEGISFIEEKTATKGTF
jgi:saccharopine dehydrogenase-like NADP-dependent oxidoreductase